MGLLFLSLFFHFSFFILTTHFGVGTIATMMIASRGRLPVASFSLLVVACILSESSVVCAEMIWTPATVACVSPEAFELVANDDEVGFRAATHTVVLPSAGCDGDLSANSSTRPTRTWQPLLRLRLSLLEAWKSSGPSESSTCSGSSDGSPSHQMQPASGLQSIVPKHLSTTRNQVTDLRLIPSPTVFSIFHPPRSV